MIGTWINVAAVLLGSLLGLLTAGRLPERVRATLMSAIGLFTFGLGVQMFLTTANPLVVLVSLVLGGLLGELLSLEDRLAGLGNRLGGLLTRGPGVADSDFVRGFLAASLLFCVGPMAILGAIQDGLSGDFRLLATKAFMDGVASLTLASALGPGVMVSALPLLLYQGTLTLLAAQGQALLSTAMVAELTATGGVMLAAIALNILEIRRVRTASLLPALVVAPLAVWLLELLKAAWPGLAR